MRKENYSCKCVPSKLGQLGIVRINSQCDCGLAYIARASPVIKKSISRHGILNDTGNGEDEVRILDMLYKCIC